MSIDITCGLRGDETIGQILAPRLGRTLAGLRVAEQGLEWRGLAGAAGTEAALQRYLDADGVQAKLVEALPWRSDAVLRAAIAAHPGLRILLQEALRNAAVPALALTGVQFTFLIGGTVITERIFSYPGIGNLAIDAVINRDLPLIQGLVLTFGVIFIAVNMLVDSMTAWLNPSLRHA